MAFGWSETECGSERFPRRSDTRRKPRGPPAIPVPQSRDVRGLRAALSVFVLDCDSPHYPMCQEERATKGAPYLVVPNQTSMFMPYPESQEA